MHPQSNIYNLQGGLFNWVNDGRDIIGHGVHPFDDFWGRLIKDSRSIRYNN